MLLNKTTSKKVIARFFAIASLAVRSANVRPAVGRPARLSACVGQGDSLPSLHGAAPAASAGARLASPHLIPPHPTTLHPSAEGSAAGFRASPPARTLPSPQGAAHTTLPRSPFYAQTRTSPIASTDKVYRRARGHYRGRHRRGGSPPSSSTAAAPLFPPSGGWRTR